MTDHRWRPNHKCLYVMGEICGNLPSFEVLINRILPLRKSDGQEDQLVCLGNYIGSDFYGAQVIDTLLNIQQQYEDRMTCLRGANEEIFLKAILGSEKDYQFWMSEYQGASTIEGYLQRADLKGNANTLPQSRLKDIVPSQHIEFLKGTAHYLEMEGYIFFNGAGIDLNKSIKENSLNSFLFGVSGAQRLQQRIRQEKELVEKIFEDGRVLVSARGNKNQPFIYSKWIMLSGKAGEILAMDLNSMEIVRVKRGKKRPYPLELKAVE
jgi:hypothetical protein